MSFRIVVRGNCLRNVPCGDLYRCRVVRFWLGVIILMLYPRTPISSSIRVILVLCTSKDIVSLSNRYKRISYLSLMTDSSVPVNNKTQSSAYLTKTAFLESELISSAGRDIRFRSISLNAPPRWPGVAHEPLHEVRGFIKLLQGVAPHGGPCPQGQAPPPRVPLWGIFIHFCFVGTPPSPILEKGFHFKAEVLPSVIRSILRRPRRPTYSV